MHGSSFLSKFSASGLTNPCILYLNGCNSQLNGSRSYCDNRDRHSDHTILEKVTSKILGELAQQGGLQSVRKQLFVGHGDWVSDLLFYMLDWWD